MWRSVTAARSVSRPNDQEPAQVHPARDGLERIEDAAQVKERDDPAARLGLGKAMQRERGLAAGPGAAERGTGAARQAAGTEKRVQPTETGGHDLVREGGSRLGLWRR